MPIVMVNIHSYNLVLTGVDTAIGYGSYLDQGEPIVIELIDLIGGS